MELALRARALTKHFAAVRALDGVDLDAHVGEVHALLGENGAGKSTLLKVVAGVHRGDGGELELFGEAFAPSGPLEAAARGVAIIHQELCLSPDLSVEQNIVLGREPRARGLVDRSRQRALAASALARLASELDPRALVRSLGPGERQIVEIARALAFDARVLILDEPTSSLTRVEVERLFDVLRSLRADGRSILYVSHFLEEVEEIADRYTVLRDGRSVASGSMSETTPAQLVEAMAGRRLDEVYPPRRESPSGDAEVALRVRSIRGQDLPRAASLDLRRGEVFGIFGLVGAGRTELLRALFGLEPSRDYDVQFGARALPTRARPAQSLAAGIGFASEDRKDEGLALELSIAHNLALGDFARYARASIVDPEQLLQGAEDYAERLSVKRREAAQAVGELSGGNQQKVALARLFHRGVDVFLLDEPTRGIDVASKSEIYRRLHEAASSGKSIVVVSSYVPELLGICDRIAVMHRGVLGPARPVSELSERGLLDEAARGAAAGGRPGGIEERAS